MRRLASSWLFASFLLSAVPAPAQEGVGEVSFANSGSPAAQEPFLRGLALLHNFEYPDAAEQFRKAQSIDPDFAMAYWGEAMTHTHPVWFQQDLKAARAVLERLGATPEARLARAKTERERDYLRAVEILYGSGSKEERDFRYSDAMALLHQRYPEDVDATAFYALSLLGTAHQGRDFATYMRSAALLEEVFPTHQHHPGVLHYLIHSYDDPVHAPLGVRAARLYGKVAPNAPHALHMTSHIFVALGQWDAVIAANQQAMSVVDQRRAAKGQPPRTCYHYGSWLYYGFLQEHRFDDARRHLAACRQEAQREIAGGPKGATGDFSIVSAYAEMRLFDFAETGRWEAADAVDLPADRYLDTKFILAYGDALAAAARGDRAALHTATARLHERHKDILALIAKDKGSAVFERPYADLVVRQVDALETLRSGKKEEGIAELRKVAEAESAMPMEFGPPAIQKPSSELLGDELLALGRHAEAEQAYQAALARAPGRTRSLQGLLRAQQTLGKTEAAERTRGQLREYVREEKAAEIR
jgi:tetratricopeptide (TPR) repeat protein